MARRRLFALLLAAGSLLGLGLYARRGAGGAKERIDLYFADGSMLSLGEDSPDAARLIPLAREAMRAARS